MLGALHVGAGELGGDRAKHPGVQRFESASHRYVCDVPQESSRSPKPAVHHHVAAVAEQVPADVSAERSGVIFAVALDDSLCLATALADDGALAPTCRKLGLRPSKGRHPLRWGKSVVTFHPSACWAGITSSEHTLICVCCQPMPNLTASRQGADKSKVPIDSDKIRRLRKGLRLSQTAAAKRAGLTGPQVWSDVENGQR